MTDIEPHLDIINVGVGQGISVLDLAYIIREVVGWGGDLEHDSSKPDGAPYKTVDGSKGERLLGWRPSTELKEGIRKTVDYYENYRERLISQKASRSRYINRRTEYV